MIRAYKRYIFVLIVIVALMICYRYLFSYKVQLRVDFSTGVTESRLLRGGREIRVIHRAEGLPFARIRYSGEKWRVVRERPLIDILHRCVTKEGTIAYQSMIQLSHMTSMMTFEEARIFSEEFLRMLNDENAAHAALMVRAMFISDELLLSMRFDPAGKGLVRRYALNRDHRHAEIGEGGRVDPDHGMPVKGSNWVSPTTGMEFMWIAEMGLWVGRHEVTNSEYRIKEPAHGSGDYDGHTLDDDRQPVVYVNFNDGKDYASWMTLRDRSSGWLPEGYRYRLPTGDEWMAFAHCGDGREYPWGNNWPPISGQAGNYGDAAAQREVNLDHPVKGYDDGHAVTAPVDELWENPWGLKGGGGNVWEMTSRTAGGDFDAWRGGSWGSGSQSNLRVASRIDFFDSIRFGYKGFRLVLAPQ